MSCLEEDNAAGIIRGRMSKLIQSTSSTDSVLTFLYEKKVINLSTLEKIVSTFERVWFEIIANFTNATNREKHLIIVTFITNTTDSLRNNYMI